MSGACYWGHKRTEPRYPCIDGENTVCPQCCVEHCPIETAELFGKCSRLHHPTWPRKTAGPPRKLVCLEGYWAGEEIFDRSSVQPFIEGLAALGGDLLVAHRKIETLDGLERVAKETLWEDRVAWDTPVYYCAFHGMKGRISVGDESAGLKVLRECFEGYGGYPHILYFGTCSTLGGVTGKRLAQELLDHAGSRAIVGYTELVEWLPGMLVDLLFMSKFYGHENPWENLRGIYDEVMSEITFAKDLGFTMVTPED